MDFRERFDRCCVDLIFLLLALLILFGGIQAANKIIDFAKTQQIEIVNQFVEGLKPDAKSKIQTKKVQSISIKYLEAFIKAVASFEFLPRNDLNILAQVIVAVPEETEVNSFSYTGRDLTIETTQKHPVSVEEMVANLEKSEEFSNVVHSYYRDNEGNYIAEITLIAYNYEDEKREKDTEEDIKLHL